MSGNSCESALQTAPMVSDLLAPCGTGGPSGALAPSSPCCVLAGSPMSAGEVGQLVLADLELVAVLEPVGVDPPAVHVGAVQRPGVVQVPVARAAHEHRVVARHGHVVEEDLR